MVFLGEESRTTGARFLSVLLELVSDLLPVLPVCEEIFVRELFCCDALKKPKFNL